MRRDLRQMFSYFCVIIFLFHIFFIFDPIFYHSADHFGPCWKVVLFFPKGVYVFYDIAMKPEHNSTGIDGRAAFSYHFAIVPLIWG